MPKKFSKCFNPRLVKRLRTYSVEQICQLYGIHPNTALSWINKEGLRRIDHAYPYLVHGDDLAEFITARQSKKIKLAVDEFRCFKCKVPRKAWEGVADIKIRTQTVGNLMVICEVCSTKMNKNFSLKNLPQIQQIFKIQQVYNSPLIRGKETSSICETKHEGNNGKI
jgi:hypothetical protein